MRGMQFLRAYPGFTMLITLNPSFFIPNVKAIVTEYCQQTLN